MYNSKCKGPFRSLIPIILASGSPRRKELLSSLGIDFTIKASHAKELSPSLDIDPKEYALKNARIKSFSKENSIVIAADTIVVLEDQVIGKPKDEQDAIHMLGRLCGRCHQVFTACVITKGDEKVEFISESKVWLSAQPLSIIKAYIATKEPMDKAGSYAVQGMGAFMVERIEGSYTNVVGLPLSDVTETLLQLEAIEANNEH